MPLHRGSAVAEASFVHHGSAMADDDAAPEERPKLAWMIGAAALLAWFAMLWFMFGEVL